VPGSRRERRPERPCRVHRRARDRPAEQRVEADRPADRQRRRRAHGAGVGRHGDDHEHQEGGQDRLVEQRRPGADARHGRAEVRRLVGPGGEQHERARGRPGELRRDVGERVLEREVPRQRERDRDGRVDVRA
jgi:hypothetical protein